jgi:hypothetical protein
MPSLTLIGQRGGIAAVTLFVLALLMLPNGGAASAAHGASVVSGLPIGQPLEPVRIVPVPLASTRVPWWTKVAEPNWAAPRGRLLTMDPTAYARSKALAAASVRPRTFRPGTQGRASSWTRLRLHSRAAQGRVTTKPRARRGRTGKLRLLGSATLQKSFDGTRRTVAGGNPPDPHGAVGTDYYTEVTNHRIEVYDKDTNALLVSQSLAGFFNYTTQIIFDPRVIRDNTSNRWIVVAIAFHEGPQTGAPQRLFIAVSQTQDVLGPFHFYQMNVNFSGVDDFDFPQLGHGSGAVLVTGNVATRNGAFAYNELLAFPKGNLYAGQFVNSLVWTGLGPSTAPPLVLDGNPNSYLISAETHEFGAQTSSELLFYRGDNLSTPGLARVTRLPNVFVGEYSIPADVPACAAGETYDSSDGRFVNASTQYGNSLWNTHTSGIWPTNGIPTPRFYEINLTTGISDQAGWYYASATSNDWNTSIAANANGDAYVTWNSLDSPPCFEPQIRFSSCEGSDQPHIMNEQGVLAASGARYNPTPEQDERWGDYSAVSLDPSNYPGCPPGRRAWIVNQYTPGPGPTTTNWATRIGRLGFC